MSLRRRTLAMAMLLSGCTAPGGDRPEPTPEETLPPPGCDGQVLLELDGAELVRSGVDGARQTLFRLGESAGLPPESVVPLQWIHRGQSIAALAFLYDDPGHRYELVRLDLGGEVMFHRIFQAEYNPTLHLADDGSMALAGEESLAVRPDGDTVELGPVHPLAAPHGDHLLVADTPPWQGALHPGWLDLHDLTREPLDETPIEFPEFVDLGSSVLYEATGDRLVVTSPMVTRAFEHPDLGPTAVAVVLDVTSDPTFVLLASSDGDRLERLDLYAQRLDPIALDDSSNAWTFDARLTPTGSVLATSLLGDGRPQLRRTDDLGLTWQPVGTPMTSQDDLGFMDHLLPIARGDRVMVLHLSRGYGDFLQEVQFVSPDASVQSIAAGGLYVNADLDPGAAALAGDGACAATWIRRADGTTGDAVFDLHWIDTVTAERTAVRSSDRVSRLLFGERPVP